MSADPGNPHDSHCGPGAAGQAELASMQKRFMAAAAITLPLMATAMSHRWSLPTPLAALVAAGVIFGAGRPLLARGLAALRSRSPDMYLLISLGVLVAYGASLASALAGSTAPLYFESAAALTTLALLGQVLELRARRRVERALGEIAELLPAVAHRADTEGRMDDVPIDELRPGNQLRVRPGESVPADGKVTDGTAHVDEAVLTGEPGPLVRQPGDKVLAGSVNQSGSFLMSVTASRGNTVVAGIDRLTRVTELGRPQITRIADRVSARFVPAVVAMAVTTALVWWALGGTELFWLGTISAINVVIIACPCALGLAAPMSVTIGTAVGARAGVLFRDLKALETLGTVDVVVVDKTGTLTEGRPVVREFIAADGDEERCLRLAASLESASEHPFARALGQLAKQRGITTGQPANFAAHPGRGATGTVDGVMVTVGSRAFVSETSVDDAQRPQMAELDRRLAQASGTPAGPPASLVFISLDGRPAAVATVADRTKATSPDAIEMLGRAGLEVIIASGDMASAVDAVADELGISTRHAAVSPAGKARLVATLRAAGKRVAMAGDGINDAPALAAADIGIAMGSGAGMAVAASAVTLVGGDLRGVARAVRLSRATMANIRQNLAFAFGYNALALPLAAGLLYPVLGLVLDPMIASMAMTMSSVSVIGNALRLGRVSL